jgi:hypothetical protein
MRGVGTLKDEDGFPDASHDWVLGNKNWAALHEALKRCTGNKRTFGALDPRD